MSGGGTGRSRVIAKVLHRNLLGAAKERIFETIHTNKQRASYRGLGNFGLESLDRFFDESRDFTAPVRSTEASRRYEAAVDWTLARLLVPSVSALDRFEINCMRLTPAEGALSRRRAAATPGARIAVEKSGRCSRATTRVVAPMLLIACPGDARSAADAAAAPA